MPQELTPVIDAAQQLNAELVLWLSGGRFRSGQSVTTILNALTATGSLSPVGAVVGSVVANYTTNANITSIIPLDDTTPLSTEGDQILSASISPKTTTNKLRCRFSGQAATLAAANVICSMFQGTTCIDAFYITITAGNNSQTVTMEAEFTPGSIASVTISVRAGLAAAGTLRFNGSASGRTFGGVANATLIVEEIKA